MELKNQFSIAHDGTEEQKRRHEVLAIQDKERREAVETMIRYRDEQLKRETERLAAERKKIADEEISKRVKPGTVLRPPGTSSPSTEQQQNFIRAEVETKYGPVHAEQLKVLDRDFNREIDRAAKEARALDEKILEERREAAQRSADGESRTATENWKKAAFQKHQSNPNSQSKGRKP